MGLISAIGSGSNLVSLDDMQGSGHRAAGSIIESSGRRETAPAIFTAGMVILEVHYESEPRANEASIRIAQDLSHSFSQLLNLHTRTKSVSRTSVTPESHCAFRTNKSCTPCCWVGWDMSTDDDKV
jgi:hypothetical protein